MDAFEVIYSAVFIAALFIIAKGWKQPKYLSMAGWLTRPNLGKTYKRKLSVLKRDEISIRFAIWTILEAITLREITQTQNCKEIVLFYFKECLEKSDSQKQLLSGWRDG